MIEISGNLGSNLHESIQGQKQDTVIFHKLSSDQTNCGKDRGKSWKHITK